MSFIILLCLCQVALSHCLKLKFILCVCYSVSLVKWKNILSALYLKDRGLYFYMVKTGYEVIFGIPRAREENTPRKYISHHPDLIN